jgi:hypothetical protein
MSDEAMLAAGTVAKFSTDLVTPDYNKIIEGLISLGAVGEMAESKERTVLADVTKKYGAGMKDAPDKTLKMQHYPLNVDQKAFIASAKANDTVLVQVTYPTPKGGTTGAIATMEFKLLGFELDDVTGEDWVMLTVNAKQNSFDFVDAT